MYFDKNKNIFCGIFLDVYYKDMKMEGKLIYWMYMVKEFIESGVMEIWIYMIFNDGGDNWFFLCDEEYYDMRVVWFKRFFF